MLIDWFTIIAQALNFIILVFLMKRFLFKPIFRALDEREKKIADELADADRKKADAKKESDDLKKKNEEFDRQRSSILNQATDEARVERKRLLDEARIAADDLKLKQNELLQAEERDLYQKIRGRTKDEVFSVVRKTLTDLAGVSLEERMVGIFIRRLHEFDREKRKEPGTALNASSGNNIVMVRTSFDLSPALRASSESAVKEVFGIDVSINFKTEPDLISGIELMADGQKVAWSIAEYLALLEKNVAELLEDKDLHENKTGTDLEESGNGIRS